ncbi:MAG: hypothetical protein Fur0041_03470 [Bacteroidia bacterium]
MEAPANKEKENNKKLHGIYLSIIGLLAIICIYLSFQYKELKTIIATREIKIEQVVKERDDVKADLVELREQYEALQTNEASLSKELEEKKAYIEQLLLEAEKHKGDAAYIAKLKKETQTLRDIMKGYVRTIDSLNQLNAKLVSEKQQVLVQLDEEKGRTQKVEKEKGELKQRIDRAALLSTLNVRASGVRMARGGKKETETQKASKVDKIKVSFDLADNDLTVAGAKDIYVRVITPDGKELTKSQDAEHIFTFGGSTGYYAAKKTIDYQNSAMSVLIYCHKAKEEDEFVPGKYIIEINADKATIGTTTLTLE